MLQIDTARLMERYGDDVQLAPYNTGSLHVPTAPRRGRDVFQPIDDYPHDEWRAKRGSCGDAVVELTVPYAVPDVASLVSGVELWKGTEPIDTIFEH